MFDEWDSFLESQVKKAKNIVINRTHFEKAKVISILENGIIPEYFIDFMQESASRVLRHPIWQYFYGLVIIGI